MRTLAWIVAVLLLLGGAAIVYFLLKGRVALPSFWTQGALSLSDIIGGVSLLVNLVLLFISILALVIALAAYQGSEKSGREQQTTLEASRKALQDTVDILQTSAKDFAESARAATGQYTLLRKELDERDEAILTALRYDVSTNMTLLEQIRGQLAAELEFLKERKNIVPPLLELHTSAWEILKISLPKRLFQTKDALQNLAEAFRLAQTFNGIIRSRENYRLHNESMDNFHRRMGLYDDDLLARIEPLKHVFQKVSAAIGSHE